MDPEEYLIRFFKICSIVVYSRAGPIHLCYLLARFNELEDLKTLLDAKIDPNYRDEDGNTAIFYSAANGHVEACKLLASYGAEFTYNKYYNSPLHRAVLLKQIPVVQFLLDTFPNVNVCQPNIYGKSALDIAFNEDNEELVTMLLKHPSAAAVEEEMKKCEKDITLNDENTTMPSEE